MLVEHSHSIESRITASSHQAEVLSAVLFHTVKPLLRERLAADLRIFCASNPDEVKRIQAFRLKYYRYALDYMLREIDTRGGDEYDEYSNIYAAEYRGRIIASIRLTPYPYESLAHIDIERLTMFLGEQWQESLEWNRLLIHPGFQARGVLQAMIVYAGIHCLLSSEKSQYFGYSTATVRHLFSPFHLDKNTMTFNIKRRGSQDYYLLKGHFVNDFMHFKQQHLG